MPRLKASPNDRIARGRRRKRRAVKRPPPRWGFLRFLGVLGLVFLGLAAALSRLWLLHRHLPRRLARAVVAAAGCAVVAATAWQQGWVERAADGARQAFADSAVAAGFTVRQVLVEGRVRQSPEELLQALGVAEGDPILQVDLALAKARLEALAWIETAIVERHLPHRIYVRVSERSPLAVWQKGGRLMLVDSIGEVIAETDATSAGQLPLIVGDGAAAAVADLVAMLASEVELAGYVAAAVRVGERRWNLRLSNGIDVQLPEEGARDAWSLLAELNRQYALLARDITIVDMRDSERLTIRLHDDSLLPDSERASRLETDA